MGQSPHDQDTIVGSAEPLSPEQTAERLRELAAWGVDLSLIEAHLAMAPTQRLQRMVEFLAVGQALHQSYMRVQRGHEHTDGHG